MRKLAGGYVKISRELLGLPFYQKSGAFSVYFHLMLTARWQDIFDGDCAVRRGQTLLSYRALADDLKLSLQSVRTALSYLEKLGEVELESNHSGTIATLLRYEQSQSLEAVGYIKVHRQILDWQWYKNANTKRLFMHLLFCAAFEDSRHISKGQLLTSIRELGKSIGISEKCVQTALSHLQKTGEVTVQIVGNRSLITVVRYGDYQRDNVLDFQKASKKCMNLYQPNGEEIVSNRSCVGEQERANQFQQEIGVPKPIPDNTELPTNTVYNTPSNTPVTQQQHTDNTSVTQKPGFLPIIEKNKKVRREEGNACARASAPTFGTRPSLEIVHPPLSARNRSSIIEFPDNGQLLSAEHVAALYTELCPSFPALSMPLTLYRRDCIAKLTRQYPDEKTLRRIFQTAENSDYLKGSDGHGWKADFDWLIDLRHIPRLLEGYYDHLWENKRRGTVKGGYMPVSGQCATYDIQDFVDFSMRRILGSEYVKSENGGGQKLEPAIQETHPIPGYDADEMTALAIRRIMDG